MAINLSRITKVNPREICLNIFFKSRFVNSLSLFLSIFICNGYLYAQNSYDVRKVNWGMTKQEVIASEYPLSFNKSESNSNTLELEGVELSNQQTATIIYTFKNGRLIEVKYCIYGFKYGNYRGTCKNIIPFSDKVRSTNSFIYGLKDKGYADDGYGWRFSNSKITHTTKSNNYGNSLDEVTLSKVANIAKQEKFCQIGLGFKNKRTDVSLDFNEYQNCENEVRILELINTPCDHAIYNIYAWLTFNPSYLVEKTLMQSDF